MTPRSSHAHRSRARRCASCDACVRSSDACSTLGCAGQLGAFTTGEQVGSRRAGPLDSVQGPGLGGSMDRSPYRSTVHSLDVCSGSLPRHTAPPQDSTSCPLERRTTPAGLRVPVELLRSPDVTELRCERARARACGSCAEPSTRTTARREGQRFAQPIQLEQPVALALAHRTRRRHGAPPASGSSSPTPRWRSVRSMTGRRPRQDASRARRITLHEPEHPTADEPQPSSSGAQRCEDDPKQGLD